MGACTMTTFLEILGTSTPVSEKLAEKLGYVKAAIACRVFFYQQLEQGVCSASVGTIAKKLGMAVGTVSSNLKWLRENDYVIVIGEHKSGNATNKYKVGSKFYEVVNGQHSGDESEHSGDECNFQEMNGKEEIKEEDKRRTTINARESENPSPLQAKKKGGSGGSFDDSCSLDLNYGEITTAYENEIGMLSGTVAQMIKDDMKSYPKQWILEAITIAVEANKRNWRYVRGILKRWRTEGRNVSGHVPPRQKLVITDLRNGQETVMERSS